MRSPAASGVAANRARRTRSPLRSTATVRGSRPSPVTRSATVDPSGTRCGSPLRKTSRTAPTSGMALLYQTPIRRLQQVFQFGAADVADGVDDQRRGAAAHLGDVEAEGEE